MSVEVSLVSLLSSIAAVYPLVLPEKQGIYPAIVYQRISTSNLVAHSGDIVGKIRYQFSIYAKSYSSCVATATAINTALNLTDLITGGNRIRFMYNENQFEVHEPETGLYRVVLEYFVWQLN